MVGSAVMGYLGGVHLWWPKITGRLYPRFLSKFAAIVVFIGFNVTFPSAVPPRLPRDAAPLSHLPAGVADAERHVLGRCHDSRRRLPDPDCLSDLVAEVRAEGLREPWGPWARVGDDLAAARAQLRDAAIVTTEAYEYAARAAREVPVGF